MKFVNLPLVGASRAGGAEATGSPCWAGCALVLGVDAVAGDPVFAESVSILYCRRFRSWKLDRRKWGVKVELDGFDLRSCLWMMNRTEPRRTLSAYGWIEFTYATIQQFSADGSEGCAVKWRWIEF